MGPLTVEEVRELRERAQRVLDVVNVDYGPDNLVVKLAEGVAQLAAEWEQLKRIEEAAQEYRRRQRSLTFGGESLRLLTPADLDAARSELDAALEALA